MPASTVDSHPQRARIIEALLNGEPVREIAKWTFPRLSPSAIQRYKATQVAPTVHTARRIESILRAENRDVSDAIPDQATRTAIRNTPTLRVRDNRLAALQNRVDRLQRIVDARAEQYADIPGGDSGLMMEDFKGENRVYRIDSTLLSELREHEKQIANELGELANGNQAQVSIQIICPSPQTRVNIGASGQTIDVATEAHEPVEMITLALPEGRR